MISNADAPVEFFVEGTRSRTGKSLHPKMGHGAWVFTMDSAVLGLASPVMVDVKGTALGCEHRFALEDAIGSHARLLEASMRVTNGIHLGSSLSHRVTL
jgi:hypothetical protein